MKLTIMEEINSIWQKSKVLVKGLMIGVLVLFLLIPAHFVQELVAEREQRQKEAVAEVSSKWAGPQILTGPMLVLPYWDTLDETGAVTHRRKEYAYFLPATLSVDATLTPLEKHRGIYKVMLYQSETVLTGEFSAISPALLDIRDESVIWEEAFLQMQVSDTRGLGNELQVRWNDSLIALTPQMDNGKGPRNAMTALVPIDSSTAKNTIRFSSRIQLNGSGQLLFTPVGKMTTVHVKSAWAHPSFTGSILPQESEINAAGFKASWTSLYHTRSFPQQWKGKAYDLDPSAQNSPDTFGNSSHAFGTDLFIPVNGYQKTMRSVKYAILCILLTFTAFFLIETSNRKSVHPVQYALIGFALILFYTLLLSISEYTGFNTAYGIAAIATVALITWFVKGLLGSMRLSVLLGLVLVLLYSFIFTILQLQDYALLLGSVGLFLTLAVVMYFSRKVRW